MRKSVVIALLAILLLNVAGYYVVFLTADFQNKREMVSRFDAGNYNDGQTELIKIPLSLAYPVQDNGFERVDGEFQYNGEFYRMVKQRLSQDTLYIVCIKDEHQKNIANALADYVKTFTDKAQDASGAKLKVDFIKDYIGSKISLSHITEGWSFALLPKEQHSSIPVVFLSIPSPPPKG